MIKKILKGLFFSIIALFVLIAVVRLIGRGINSITPKGGINENFYVDINESKQWISIYGKDRNNPVLLYLHGGPGSSTSAYDYAFTRKWSDIYTVVTWDQRNCGKSYSKEQTGKIEFTHDMFMEDGKQMTEFVRNYLGKDKITLIGHSWGSFLGANLALEYPGYYDCYIGTGQVIDMEENEKRFVEAAREWAKGDSEGEKLLEDYNGKDFDVKWIMSRNKLMEMYGYAMNSVKYEYNWYAAIFFNPYYSIMDIYKQLDNLMHYESGDYAAFVASPEFNKFSLGGRYDYKVPYYNINGDRDYQTNFELAQEYFDKVNAPKKKMIMMKDMTHLLLEAGKDEYTDYLREIATETVGSDKKINVS